MLTICTQHLMSNLLSLDIKDSLKNILKNNQFQEINKQINLEIL